MYSSAIYKKSPVIIQSAMVSLRGLIRGAIRSERRIASLKKRLKENEHSEEMLAAFREERLEHALSNAKGTEAFKQNIEFSEFGYVDKNDVKASPSDFTNKHIKPFITVKGSTSGTTGAPLSIPQNLDSVLREQAFVSRYLEWAGFKQGDRRAWLRGDLVVPMEQKRGPFWRYSYFENMIVMSSFHLSSEAIPSYLKAMEDYGVDIIQAYPSSIATLAKYLESVDQYYQGRLKSIITSSEALSQEDRQIIEKRFKCKVFDWYGLFERVAAIGSCEHGNYHLISDYSHVEFVESEDGKHEIVGTSYNNALYPLIRYRTGDHVVLATNQTCPCGRVFPVIKSIEGRTVSHVYNEDHQKVYALDQCVKGVAGVIGSQYNQDQFGSITVSVLVNDEYDHGQEEKLVSNVKARLGSSMQVNIDIVETLVRSKNGKVIQAICTIEDDEK